MSVTEVPLKRIFKKAEIRERNKHVKESYKNTTGKQRIKEIKGNKKEQKKQRKKCKTQRREAK
jgi:hypothetical protein